MEYKDLEQEYDKIFKEKVLPFIVKNVKRDSLSEPVYHLLDGLKINRFRSGLPIIVAREYGIDEDLLVPISALCELTFTTAMAQDDFYDNDLIREGLKSAHTVFGVRETLLSCDYFNHKILSLLVSSLSSSGVEPDKINKLLKIINDELAIAYSSVIMEINSKKDLFSVDENYLKNIYLSKTAHGRMLLECVFLMIGETQENLTAIVEYSNHLAMAGQLKNDIYDYVKHQKFRGLSDLREGHITWPLFLLINSLNKDEKQSFLDDLHNQRYEKLIQLLRDKKIFEQVLELINFHVEEAKKIVNGRFPETIRAFLETWAEGNRHFSKEPKL